jgi:hypothetical protein
MSKPEITGQLSPEWRPYTKIVFRFFFVYFLIQTVPLDWKYYAQVFSINWAALRYEDIFNLAHYQPQFLSGTQSFGNWGIAAFIALAGTFIWTYADHNRTKDYDRLYYWLRVIVRYRLAIGIIAYGFIKFFPLQAPYPSISNLNTHYGDFTRWKLFSLSLGVVPSYELFLGLVEILAGLLLFYRKTASIGALIIVFFTGNVFVSNLAYEGGEYVYSFYLISLALFVLVYDIRRLADLLVWQRPATPNRFRIVFHGRYKYARWLLKGAFIFFFVVLYGFKTGAGYRHDPYQFPQGKGLSAASGIYNVTTFRINNDTLPYSKTDPVRWQDVVFEQWPTISVRTNTPVIIDSNNVEKVAAAKDIDKTYEAEGTNERSYYDYKADTVNHVLTLLNKNVHYKGESLLLHYDRPSASRIILSGIDQHKDSIYVVLDRIDKRYLLEEAAKEGRGRGLKL